jgi:hypothetical protein
VKYQAISPVTLPVSAVVKLTADQLRRRRHLVKPAQADGWYEVTAALQFKTGEEFETEHGMSKANTVAIGPEAAAPDTPAADAPHAKAAPAKPAAKR